MDSYLAESRGLRMHESFENGLPYVPSFVNSDAGQKFGSSADSGSLASATLGSLPPEPQDLEKDFSANGVVNIRVPAFPPPAVVDMVMTGRKRRFVRKSRESISKDLYENDYNYPYEYDKGMDRWSTFSRKNGNGAFPDSRIIRLMDESNGPIGGTLPRVPRMNFLTGKNF